MWRLTVCNETLTQNCLVRKRTLKHLALNFKLSSTYLYGVVDCMFLSIQVRVSEWIQTL